MAVAINLLGLFFLATVCLAFNVKVKDPILIDSPSGGGRDSFFGYRSGSVPKRPI
jgi:hypothetical protein